MVYGAMGCSPIYDYVASDRESPSEKTTVYSDDNGVRVRLSGLNYYLNMSPKRHKFIVQISSGAVLEKIVILPPTVKLELFHEEKSLLGPNQGEVNRVYSSAHVCGENEYPDRIRDSGLPSEIEVPGRCQFAVNFRYFLELPSLPDKLEARVEFEYRTGDGQIKVSESISLYLDQKTFFWVYAT
jgi:hypothetical protein